MRHLRWVAPLLGGLVVGGLGGCGPSFPPSAPHALLGQAPAPQSSMTLDGTMVRLPQAGHVTVIDVWATWCAPCLAMMPALEQLHEQMQSQGVRVVGVAADDNPGLVQQVARERGVRYPTIVDASGEVRGWLRGNVLPLVLVFDRQGRLRWVQRGEEEPTIGQLRRAVEALVAEGG